jgi:acyl-CoA reductase-like NAD-dependent aldehyde dehydrogenase
MLRASGVKKSGIGRDNGTFGIDAFLEVKQVTAYADVC